MGMLGMLACYVQSPGLGEGTGRREEEGGGAETNIALETSETAGRKWVVTDEDTHPISEHVVVQSFPSF